LEGADPRESRKSKAGKKMPESISIDINSDSDDSDFCQLLNYIQLLCIWRKTE
jgi:hypothetical protein